MIGPIERSRERDAAVDAMLPNVPFDGWTKRALRNGGIDPGDAGFLFPRGVVQMIETFYDLADRRMEEQDAHFQEERLSRRVRAVITLRLRQNRVSDLVSHVPLPNSRCAAARIKEPAAAVTGG